MTDDRSLERSVRSWLEEGPTVAPAEPVDAALARIEGTSQEWGPLAPWRLPTMHPFMRLAGAAVVAAIAVAGALYVFAGGGGTGDVPGPSASIDVPSAAPSASEGPIDTSSWTPYVSERYGFSISHPPDWSVRPSTHEWTIDADFTDLGPEGFRSPSGSILVTAWSVEVPAGTTLDAWVQMYCEATTSPCDDLQGMAEPVYAEVRDRHEGVLIPFELDTHAFVPGWYDGSGSIWTQPATSDLDRIYVVAAWRPDGPTYDSRRLVEAFTLTMFLDDPAPES